MAAAFNQVEFVMEENRKIMIRISKWYAKSLSNDKIIYSRDEYTEDCLS